MEIVFEGIDTEIDSIYHEGDEDLAQQYAEIIEADNPEVVKLEGEWKPTKNVFFDADSLTQPTS